MFRTPSCTRIPQVPPLFPGHFPKLKDFSSLSPLVLSSHPSKRCSLGGNQETNSGRLCQAVHLHVNWDFLGKLLTGNKSIHSFHTLCAPTPGQNLEGASPRGGMPCTHSETGPGRAGRGEFPGRGQWVQNTFWGKLHRSRPRRHRLSICQKLFLGTIH